MRMREDEVMRLNQVFFVKVKETEKNHIDLLIEPNIMSSQIRTARGGERKRKRRGN